MKNLNDIACVELVLGGDTEAFAILVGRYSGKVFPLIERICGNREDAEELTQDAFVKAYEHLHKFRRESTFSTWIYRIAYNTAISHTRKRHFRMGEWQDERMKTDELLFLPEEGPEEKEEQLQRLEQALEALPPDDRALVLLYYHEDRPVGEIARITGLSESNVKTRLHRIRKRLGILYDEKIV